MEKFQALQSLDQLFVKIADALGVAVDQVQQNGIEYIMMYGKYQVVVESIDFFKFITAISAIIFIFILAVLGDYFFLDDNKQKVLKFIKYYICIYVIVLIFLIGSNVLPYIVSPEMYSIEKALELVR